jgi:uroporphyrinogen decarboxylase
MDEEEIREKLNDDFRWITPQYIDSTYKHPEGKGIFNVWKYKKYLSEPGPLADASSVKEVSDYDWPDPSYLNFDETISILDTTGDYYRASGFWMPFFHDISDLFGMENLFMKMYTEPEIIAETVNKVCSFYYKANELFYNAAGDKIDALFFGNDFGSQTDLLISPSQFDEFFLPWIKKFAEQAHKLGYQVIMHSCGSVYKIIDRLIDAGIDCLHPLQAKAAGMDAENLSNKFKGRIAFLGGLDTQNLLVNGTPDEIKKEVERIKKLLGPELIISPSHEALLPNVPPENILAMAELSLR